MTYVSQPLDPQRSASELEHRTLDAPAVRAAAERVLGHPVDPWPPRSWTLDLLTAAAFELNPQVAVARAEYATARASLVTARELPNPSATVSVEHKNEPKPWVTSYGLDLTLELPAKRRARRDLAIHAANAALVRVSAAAWEARARLRSQMLDVWAAGQRQAVLERQKQIDADIVELFARRVQLGEAAQLELSRARIAAAQSSMLLRDAGRASSAARAAVAAAAGVPDGDLASRDLDLSIFAEAPPSVADSMREAALVGRADIRAALFDYSVAEDALRLEIARQVPDLHLGPAFGWDQGAQTWILAAAAELPLFHRHAGAIGEAMARRDESAARFAALQASVIAAFDQARIGVEAARAKLADADAIVAAERAQLATVRAQFDAGEVDRLALRSTELEGTAAELSRVDAAVELQQAIAMLEDAVQQPLAPSAVTLETRP